MSDQYSAYEVQPGLKVNGDLTLGENIADLGGVRLSYRAWKNQGGGAGEPGVEGLSHDQLFFVAFAQSWCSVYSPEFEKIRKSDDRTEFVPDQLRLDAIHRFPVDV